MVVSRESCNGFVIGIKESTLTLSALQSGATLLNPNIQITSIEQNGTNYFLIHCTYTSDHLTISTIILQVSGKNYVTSYNPILPALYYSAF